MSLFLDKIMNEILKKYKNVRLWLSLIKKFLIIKENYKLTGSRRKEEVHERYLLKSISRQIRKS